MRFANLPECRDPGVSAFESADSSAQSKKSSLRVAGVVPVSAFRQQTFATALASACEGGATAFGPHTSAKAVLAFPGSLGWLIGAFHKSYPLRERLQ
jgi:hypothetical protein